MSACIYFTTLYIFFIDLKNYKSLHDDDTEIKIWKWQKSTKIHPVDICIYSQSLQRLWDISIWANITDWLTHMVIHRVMLLTWLKKLVGLFCLVSYRGLFQFHLLVLPTSWGGGGPVEFKCVRFRASLLEGDGRLATNSPWQGHKTLKVSNKTATLRAPKSSGAQISFLVK